MARSILRVSDPVRVQFSEIGRLYKGSPKGTSKRGYAGGDDYESHYLRFEPADRLKLQPATESGFGSLHDELKARWETLINQGSVRFVFPFSTIEECFPWENKVVKTIGGTAKTMVRCDGVTCSLWTENEEVKGKSRPVLKRGDRPCQADDRHCPLGCAPKGMLKMMIPDLYPGGLVCFPIGSTIDIAAILGGLEPFKNYDLRGIPFSLFRKQEIITWEQNGETKTKVNWGVKVEVLPTIAAKLQAKHVRDFDQYLDGEVGQARSIGAAKAALPSAKVPTMKGSDDGYRLISDLAKAVRNHNLEAIETIQSDALELVDSGFYDEASIAFIHYECDRSRALIKEVLTANPIVQKIVFFQKVTEYSKPELLELVASLGLPQSSSQYNEAQANTLVIAMLEGYFEVEGQTIDRIIQKESARSNNLSELWDNICLAVEAFEAENQEV
jgi:hypothetical protein